MSDTPESVRTMMTWGACADVPEIYDALERYAELLERSAGEWVPVTDSEPANDVFKVCYRPTADMKVYFQCRFKGQWQEEDGSPTIPATHFLDVKLPGGE